MYIYTRTQYPRYTRTYKQYTHVYWVQEIHERNLTYKSKKKKRKKIHFKHILLFRKKKCFCFLLKKTFWLSGCRL